MELDNYEAELEGVDELLRADPTNPDLLLMKQDLLQMIRMQNTLTDMQNPNRFSLEDEEKEIDEPSEDEESLEVYQPNQAWPAFTRAPKPLLPSDISNPIVIIECDSSDVEVIVPSDHERDDEVLEISPPPTSVSTPVTWRTPRFDVKEIGDWEKHTTVRRCALC